MLNIKDVDDDITINFSKEQTSEWPNILISIKVFFEWILNNFDLFHEIFKHTEKSKVFVDFLNLCVQALSKMKKKNLTTPYPIKLEEDLELSGFLPLISSKEENEQSAFISEDNFEYILGLSEAKVKIIKTTQRLEKILRISEFLCKAESQDFLKFDIEKKVFYLKNSSNYSNEFKTNIIQSKLYTTDTEIKLKVLYKKNNFFGGKNFIFILVLYFVLDLFVRYRVNAPILVHFCV